MHSWRRIDCFWRSFVNCLVQFHHRRSVCATCASYRLRKLKAGRVEQQVFLPVGTAIGYPSISQAENDHREGTTTHDTCLSLSSKKMRSTASKKNDQRNDYFTAANNFRKLFCGPCASTCCHVSPRMNCSSQLAYGTRERQASYTCVCSI